MRIQCLPVQVGLLCGRDTNMSLFFFLFTYFLCLPGEQSTWASVCSKPGSLTSPRMGRCLWADSGWSLPHRCCSVRDWLQSLAHRVSVGPVCPVAGWRQPDRRGPALPVRTARGLAEHVVRGRHEAFPWTCSLPLHALRVIRAGSGHGVAPGLAHGRLPVQVVEHASG